MEGYIPIDLAPMCNVGEDWVVLTDETWSRYSFGLSTMRGIPFLVGSPDDRLMGFGEGGYTDAVEIAVGRKVEWLVFAHQLLESRLDVGEPVGQTVATYRMRYANGDEADVAIRERFQISTVPVRTGQLPFLAVPDEQDRLHPERYGPWGDTGFRQTEVIPGQPRTFVLWAWRNPEPDRLLETILVDPGELAFLIGGVTASSLEEDPFGREPAMLVRVNSPPAQTSAPNLACIRLEVDRGVASYVRPLLHDSFSSFISDPVKGWGEPRSASSASFGYARVVAVPSATLTLSDDTKSVASASWVDVKSGATTDEDRTIEMLSNEKNWVHVHVVDDVTGEPIPCRVHFRSEDGVPHQPHGHHNHLISHDHDGTWHIDVGGDVLLGNVVYAYIDGSCQGWLPRGTVGVDIARGFEYEPIRTEVTIRPGQRDLTFRLRRWVNMNEEGWYSGDPHVHFLSTYGALFEGQAEDLNVVNLLQAQWGHLFTGIEEPLGRPVTTPDGKTVVYTSQENRQHLLGHLSLLGLKRPIMPWGSDGPAEGELGGSLETTLGHWADEAHAQGGTVILAHHGMPTGEQAALIATGRAEAAEMIEHDMHKHIEYYRYLNAGYRMPLAGGSDKMTAEHLVGLYRTYVNIPHEEGFSYENWCGNLRLGRTFISGGPILWFQVEGAAIGDTIHLGRDGRTVEVQAEAESVLPIHTLQVILNGRVVAASESRDGARRLEVREAVRIDQDSWLAARVGGPGYWQPARHNDGRRRGVMAHTSPIYATLGDDWEMKDLGTAHHMRALLAAQVGYIEERSRQFPQGTVAHHHGEEDHHSFLLRPFREAIEALEARYPGIQHPA